jgi:hypothetical protein
VTLRSQGRAFDGNDPPLVGTSLIVMRIVCRSSQDRVGVPKLADFRRKRLTRHSTG